MRHPNIILFMGVVLEPAAVVTGVQEPAGPTSASAYNLASVCLGVNRRLWRLVGRYRFAHTLLSIAAAL
jgi:hypothetical protein